MAQQQKSAKAGLGMMLLKSDDPNDSRPMVGKVISGGPAKAAGIRTGDIVTRVNGVECTGVKDASSRIIGSPGTDVTVSIFRPHDQTSQTLKMQRKEIPRDPKPVKAHVIPVAGSGITVAKTKSIARHAAILDPQWLQQHRSIQVAGSGHRPVASPIPITSTLTPHRAGAAMLDSGSSFSFTVKDAKDRGKMSRWAGPWNKPGMR